MPIFSMQQPARKYGIEFAKKLISKSCTVAHWGISTGPFIAQGLGRLGSSAFDKEVCDYISAGDSGISGYEADSNGNQKPIYRNKALGCADNAIQQLADEQAKKVGLTKKPSVRTWDFSVSPLSAIQNVVLIQNKYESELKNALKTNDEKKINEFAGILQHEDTHIKNQDNLVHGLECLATPLLTHQVVKSASKIMPFTQKIMPFWVQQGIKLSSGLGKYALNTAILSASSRHKEQRADDGICNDIATLQAVSDSFIQSKKEYDAVSKNYLEQNFPKVNYYLFASHPTMDARITKFNKRIELLKKEKQF